MEATALNEAEKVQELSQAAHSVIRIFPDA